MQVSLYDFKAELQMLGMSSKAMSKSFGRLSVMGADALSKMVANFMAFFLDQPRLYKRIDPGRRAEEFEPTQHDYLGSHPPSSYWNLNN